jgi:putative lipoic acid-binding regulatory protein
VVRSGLTLEQAVAEAVDRHAARAAAEIDQAALDEAARQGFAGRAFEDLDEDVPAVVEEAYPTGHGSEVAQAPAKSQGQTGSASVTVNVVGGSTCSDLYQVRARGRFRSCADR